MIDRVYIHVTAGRGGRGTVAFRREKFVPRGGPAGGDGGRGGSVILAGDRGLNSLASFRFKRFFKAESGRPGGGSNKTGRDGEDLLIEVPEGTEVFEVLNDQEDVWKLGDLIRHGQRLIVAVGGGGGRGNSRFVTSVNREPVLAEDGEDGEVLKLRLDLKLVADVGIVGRPNAGKSSLIAALSNARPKVADYAFTTLEPNLGVVEYMGRTLVAVDVPGLIEGAHAGAGLGDAFLRHLERTRLLVHLVDGSEGQPAERYRLIQSELERYEVDLTQWPQVVVVNKEDIPEVHVLRDEIREELGSVTGAADEIEFISAVARTNIETLKMRMFRELERLQDAEGDTGESPVDAGEVVLRPPGMREEQPAPAIRVDGGFAITHPRAVRLANGSDLSRWKAQIQMRERLRSLGVTDELVRLGISAGDMVSLGEWDFEWE